MDLDSPGEKIIDYEEMREKKVNLPIKANIITEATISSTILFLLMNIMTLLLAKLYVAELCLYTKRYL